MNRLLEHQIPIQMSITNYEADSVDTIEDLKRVETKMKVDKLYNKYKAI